MNRQLIVTVLLAVIALVSISLFVYSNLQPQPPPVSGNAQTGAALYAQYCSSCHGDLAVSTRRGHTAAQIQTAIANVPVMQGLSVLTAQQIQDIAAALAGQ